MVLTVTRATAVPPPRAPINGIFGAPAPQGLIAIPLIPALFFRPLGHPVGHPGLEILLLGRRIHILRYEDILPRRIATGAKSTAHLSRDLWKSQGIAHTGRNRRFLTFCLRSILHAKN